MRRRDDREEPFACRRFALIRPASVQGFRSGRTGVHEILKASDLKPHLQHTLEASEGPAFAEEVRDVVGLYLNPPGNAVVTSLDEKSQVQAVDRTQPMPPLKPGQVERRTHDDTRPGIVDLFRRARGLNG